MNMNTNKIKSITLILLITTILLTACGTPAAEEGADNESIIATSIAETLQAVMETQNAEEAATTASTATPTNDVSGSPTATTSGTPIANIPTIPVSPNCLVAGLVSETIPDGTLFQKDATFTKTWKIRNAGTCTWSTAYKLVFVDGNALGAPEEIKLKENVPPGNITNISINMKAPNVDATYIGYWMLQTDAGVQIAPFSVKIVVGTATPTPIPPYAVTSVTSDGIDIGPPCPPTYAFNISITSNGVGTVTYYIDDSISGAGVLQSKDFTAAGTQTIPQSISIAGVGGHEIRVYIEQPNHQLFGSPFFTVTCP